MGPLVRLRKTPVNADEAPAARLGAGCYVAIGARKVGAHIRFHQVVRLHDEVASAGDRFAHGSSGKGSRIVNAGVL